MNAHWFGIHDKIEKKESSKTLFRRFFCHFLDVTGKLQVSAFRNQRKENGA